MFTTFELKNFKETTWKVSMAGLIILKWIRNGLTSSVTSVFVNVGFLKVGNFLIH
jgi:hypothetical protein